MTGLTPPEDRRPPITPQLALRVAILGGVALALFAIVFFRLWFLQVLSGDQYLAQASTNRVRDVVVQAPRGELIDRHGTALVENRRAVAVVVSPPKLPADAGERTRELTRLSRVIGMSTRPQKCRVGRDVVRTMEVDCLVRRGVWNLPYANVTIKTDVSRDVAFYLAERAQQFPGVSIQQVFLRHYRFGDIGAQLFGTVGQIDAAQLKEDHYRGVRGGTIVGQSGLEYTYDRYLRGRDGATRVQVDALGQAKGYLPTREPAPGANLQTVARPRPAARGPGGARDRHRARERERQPVAGRRVRRARPAQRRGARDGLGADASTRTCSPRPLSQRAVRRALRRGHATTR